MDCVFEPNMETAKTNNFSLKGNWNEVFFKNNNPIVLELGCGKGEYAVGLGEKFKEKNFIGVDVKGARVWEGANYVRENNLTNIAFVRARIDFVDTYFGANEIDEIWLTFSDPQPNKPNKRLSSKVFIDKYKAFLKPGGIIHLKTDSDLLFESTLHEIEQHGYKLIEHTWDLYGEMAENIDETTQDILSIKTNYETIFAAKGFEIKYCKFTVS